MPEIRFTWGQIKAMAAHMGLEDDDPAPDGSMLTMFFEVARLIEDAAGEDGAG